MSRFKHRKFDVTCDSNGTNCWIPVEQAKALLCDAMAVEAENERLRKEADAMKHWIVWKGYDFPGVNYWSAAAKKGGAK